MVEGRGSHTMVVAKSVLLRANLRCCCRALMVQKGSSPPMVEAEKTRGMLGQMVVGEGHGHGEEEWCGYNLQ